MISFDSALQDGTIPEFRFTIKADGNYAVEPGYHAHIADLELNSPYHTKVSRALSAERAKYKNQDFITLSRDYFISKPKFYTAEVVHSGRSRDDAAKLEAYLHGMGYRKILAWLDRSYTNVHCNTVTGESLGTIPGKDIFTVYQKLGEIAKLNAGFRQKFELELHRSKDGSYKYKNFGGQISGETFYRIKDLHTLLDANSKSWLWQYALEGTPFKDLADSLNRAGYNNIDWREIRLHMESVIDTDMYKISNEGTYIMRTS
jgi:hypothetical protein